MKKFTTILLVVVILAVACVALVACNKSVGADLFKDIEVKDGNYLAAYQAASAKVAADDFKSMSYELNFKSGDNSYNYLYCITEEGIYFAEHAELRHFSVYDVEGGYAYTGDFVFNEEGKGEWTVKKTAITQSAYDVHTQADIFLKQVFAWANECLGSYSGDANASDAPKLTINPAEISWSLYNLTVYDAKGNSIAADKVTGRIYDCNNTTLHGKIPVNYKEDAVAA